MLTGGHLLCIMWNGWSLSMSPILFVSPIWCHPEHSRNLKNYKNLNYFFIIKATLFWTTLLKPFFWGLTKNKLIGGTLDFGSRGPWLKCQWGRKIFPLLFLSSDLMISVYHQMNSWLCKVLDSLINSSCWKVMKFVPNQSGFSFCKKLHSY